MYPWGYMYPRGYMYLNWATWGVLKPRYVSNAFQTRSIYCVKNAFFPGHPPGPGQAMPRPGHRLARARRCPGLGIAWPGPGDAQAWASLASKGTIFPSPEMGSMSNAFQTRSIHRVSPVYRPIKPSSRRTNWGVLPDSWIRMKAAPVLKCCEDVSVFDN